MIISKLWLAFNYPCIDYHLSNLRTHIAILKIKTQKVQLFCGRNQLLAGAVTMKRYNSKNLSLNIVSRINGVSIYQYIEFTAIFSS